MFYLLEILSLAYLAVLCARVLRQGTARNLVGVGIFLLATLVGTLALYMGQVLSEQVFDNLSLVILVPLAAAVAGYVATSVGCARRLRRPESGVVARLQGRLRLPRWLDRVCCGALALLLVGGVAVALLFLVSLAGVEEHWRTKMAGHSLFLHAFLPPVTAPAPPPPATAAQQARPDAQQALSLQKRFLAGLGKTWHRTREAVATRTGTKAAVRHLEALKFIINLSPQEHAWLVETSPGLKTLLHHPSLEAIMAEDRILDQIEAVGRGSPTAIYALGQEPAIQAFFKDKQIMAVVRTLDLVALQQHVEARRRALGVLVPIQWATAAIASTLELDGALQDPTRWENAPPNTMRLCWAPDTPIGLAAAGFVHQAEIPAPLHVRLETPGVLTVLVNDRSIELKTDGKARTFILPFRQGLTRLVILVDFSGVEGAFTCLAEARTGAASMQ